MEEVKDVEEEVIDAEKSILAGLINDEVYLTKLCMY